MVKITFKTVQNKLFTIEAEETETVADLKKKIEESQTFPVAQQKLIFSGKILQDAATVSSLKIKEKDFLVIMVTKPKAAPATPAAPAAAVSTPAAPSTPAPAVAASASAPAATPASPSPAGPAASAGTDTSAPAAAPAAEAAPSYNPEGSFIAGETLQNAINEMVSMGFTRDQVQRALRASFNNPDRAMEYLFSGNIPEIGGMGATPAPPAAAAAPPAAAAPAPTPAAAPAPAQTPAAAPAPPSNQGSSADNLFAAAEAAMNRDRGIPAAAAPRAANPAAAAMGAGAGAGAGGLNPGNPPSLEGLREAVAQNPALIQPLIQRIAAQHPQVAQMLNENPQALYEMLGLGLEGDDDDEMMGMGGMGGQEVVQVNLTEEEAAAVARLEALGFDRATVLQCYLACDRQEELAANMLFDFQNED